MRRDFVFILILNLIFLSGCIKIGPVVYDTPPNEAKEDISTKKIPIGLDFKPKDYDCSKEENFNITYVEVRVGMEPSETAPNPNYRWYPSLNEGKINWINMWGYNKGCTKIKLPVITEVYIVHSDKIIYYKEGYDNDSSYSITGSGYAYPQGGDVFQINPVGQVRISVPEKGNYEIIVIAKDKETNQILGAGKTDFEMQ